MSAPQLTLEIVSGPLDGLEITLKETAEWGRSGDRPLSFPWDEELGAPQARFLVETERWWMEPLPNGRSTRHNMEPIEGKVPLAKGDLLKATNTWLLITEIEPQQEK